ncbi:MAG: hypothetical protein B5M52_01855 [Helicobacteraceae bacterium 4484_230]|nr:MAG: hypothetical protein B5M52_01855 [Helicobacteraceae bacterium 4484_230]
MKIIKIVLIAMSLLPLSLASAQKEARLVCSIVNEEIEKILCKVELPRVDYDREVKFLWHSSSYPQDDRERTIILSAGHSSVYDYRFLRGRAQGEWVVKSTVNNIDKDIVAEQVFMLDGAKLIKKQ